MSTDILNLKYTAEEFDDLVKNVENTVTEVVHDTAGILTLDIADNRNFNIIVSAEITGLSFSNVPQGLSVIVKTRFIQGSPGGFAIDIGSIESKDTVAFSTEYGKYDIATFEMIPMNGLSDTICTNFAAGFTVVQ